MGHRFGQGSSCSRCDELVGFLERGGGSMEIWAHVVKSE